MSERRDREGRLDMDVVRGIGSPPPAALGSGNESRAYTEEWIRRVEPDTTRSLGFQGQGEPIANDEQRRSVQSAPALSMRSGASNRSTKSLRLELELKYLKEKQDLDKEQRELELQAQKHAIEQQKKLAELQEKRKVHELESKLAEARLQEELDQNDSSGESTYDEENEGLLSGHVEPQTVVISEGDDNQRLNVGESSQGQVIAVRAQQSDRSAMRPPGQPESTPPVFVPQQLGRQSSQRVDPTDDEPNGWPETNDSQRPGAELGVRATTAAQSQRQPPGATSSATPRQPFNLDGRQPPVFAPRHFRPQLPPNGGFQRFGRRGGYPDSPFFVRQMFESQQQALNMMANTIGTTLSKGFEMPRREYLTFDGNPLAYPSFMENFKTNVEDVEPSANARRNFLIQLCSGKAKDAISGTIMLPPEEGFQKAKSILREMFGQTHIIAASHIDKLISGGVIKENENEKLMQLARDMENCEMNLNSLGCQADINSRSNMSAVVLRRPRYLRSDWAKEAQNSRDKGQEPNFAQLTKFVVKKAKLANTEYGRLICAKPNIERENVKKPRFGSKQVSAYLSRGSQADERSESNWRSQARSMKPK